MTVSFRTVDGTATTSDGNYIAKSDKKEANETFYLDLFGNSSNSFFNKTATLARFSMTTDVG